MLESWILPLGIVSVFAVILLLPLVEALFPRIFRRVFHCPWVGSEVRAEFVERCCFGIVGPPDVSSCSAFADPRKPTCGKACVGSIGRATGPFTASL
jgi:hypothetical protein